MPRIIEAPDEFVEAQIAVEDNERSQRNTDLSAPEAFVPRASPVDLSRGVAQDSKLETLRGISQILESSVGTTAQGLQYFRGLQQRTKEEEKDEVGLAMRETEVIEAAPPGPLRRFFQGANPFIGQGRNEQFGENTRIRAAAAFESALIAERTRRAELRAQGQEAPSIETPEEVLAFAQDFFDTEMLNHELGRDPHFQRGFQEDLRADLAAILQREEVARRERVVDEAHEAGAQLTRELQAAYIDDVTGSVSPSALEEGVTAWVDTGVATGLGTQDELVRIAITASGADLLDRVRRDQWQDLGPNELGTIRQQLMSVAGADTDNRARISDMIETVQSAIDTKQSDASKAADAADDAYLEQLHKQMADAALSNDNARQREIAQEMVSLNGDAGAASAALQESLNFASSVGVETANEAAFNYVIEQMDLQGLTARQVNRLARDLEQRGGFAFTTEQRGEFRVEQNRNQGRGRVRNDESFKTYRRELLERIKQAGGAATEDPFAGLFGGLTSDQIVTADAYQQIVRAFDQRVIGFAADAGGIEAIRSTEAWGRTLRHEADEAKKQINALAQSANAASGPEERRKFLDTLRLEQSARDRRDAAVEKQVQAAPITLEEKVQSVRAVRDIQLIERAMSAFPEERDPTSPFMDPMVAMRMNGVAVPEDDFRRANEALADLPIPEIQPEPPPERPQTHESGDTAFQPLRRDDFVDLAAN